MLTWSLSISGRHRCKAGLRPPGKLHTRERNPQLTGARAVGSMGPNGLEPSPVAGNGGLPWGWKGTQEEGPESHCVSGGVWDLNPWGLKLPPPARLSLGGVTPSTLPLLLASQ